MFIYSSSGITYSLNSSASTLNEGQSVTFTLTTTGIPNGTNIPYTVTGISAADLSSGSMSGNFTISSNTATAAFTKANDLVTEGTETMTLSLNNGKASANVTIYDTSVPLVTKSLLFTRTSGQFLSKTWGSNGNRQKWTVSFWLKQPSPVAAQQAFFSGGSGSNTTGYGYNGSYYLYHWIGTTGPYGSSQRTDFGTVGSGVGWTHYMWVVDTTLATANDRVRFGFNNTLSSMNTSYGTNPPQNHNTSEWSQTTNQHRIGSNTSGSPIYFNGYMADIYIIDGQVLSPSDFAGYNGLGQWRPKPYTGSYSGNSCHLDFTNGSSTTTLGYDSSGLGNHWTLNAMTTANQTTDVP